MAIRMYSERDYHREYYNQNQDKLRGSNHEYYLRKKDTIKEMNLDYYARNKMRRKEYDQEYYARNKDKRKKSREDYYDRNKDDIAVSNRRYYLRNRHEIADSSRSYYSQNSDDVRKNRRNYYARNKDKEGEYRRASYLQNFENPELYSPRNAASKSWKTAESVREYLDSVASRLEILDFPDWYRVSRLQLLSLGGGALYHKFENLGGALQFAYPEIHWDLSKFSLRGKKSDQRWLRILIEEILPGIEIVEDYLHPDLFWDQLDRNIELDLWLPQHRIGVEFQGEHHYHNLDSAFGPNGTTSFYSERDSLKQSFCCEQGITLVTIPFWWEGGKESLSASLYRARPDVFPVSTSPPIPNEMPRVRKLDKNDNAE